MTRWLEETGGTRGEGYDAHFAALEARGAAVHGEADLVRSLVPPGARVLDAGCGTGRVARELARHGHPVVGVDSDPSMLDVARRRSPGLEWRLQDLLDLPDEGCHDVVVAAGNVMVFLAPGTGPAVVARLAAAARPGGLVVAGWRTDLLHPSTYDGWCTAAGLQPVARWATWDRAPLQPTSDWCVAVDVRPPG